jgi:endonuclease/exonuclease/phosphatase family metal-dependent hydrolase
MRVLTVNCHKGFSSFNRHFALPKLREAIRNAGPDIVFLQEVVGEDKIRATKRSDWPGKSQYEYLADTIWNDFAYGKNAEFPSRHHGNALLSRFPIIRSRNINISTNKIEKRGLLHCVVEVPRWSKELHCICVHLGLLSRSRKKQFVMIEKYVCENIPGDSPLIIAGDFNDWQVEARDLLLLPLQLTDASAKPPAKLPRTFPAAFPLLKLDRIYVRGFGVATSKRCRGGVWTRVTDHLAIMTDLKLRGNARGTAGRNRETESVT